MHCVLTLLSHFHPRIPIGVSCDASDLGIGALRQSDRTKGPIDNRAHRVKQFVVIAGVPLFRLNSAASGL